ncbi:serine hydrolase domain-containing protein [Umezawaea sp. Da 62-37]|uniref:serine hydrolase domain-containing protein n=1 Tax=Umezawaea sp. Da 62-37 TaxID=3075927 RepID=UPI0028F6E467|nr:serine hydrolase domain-containing protein [Umezawaea sp. Da 62-37]WNV88909.1 serine hydrolase domain-containing protein [Umezawaea sp. Da 62-37]
MKRTCAVLMAMTTVLGTTAVGVADASADKRTLQRDADALLALGAPGVLVQLDTPTWRARVRSGFGDVAAGTPVPWDARFRIGSYTKTFVAATLLQLVGEGELSLEDSVERWLPGVVAGNGNDGAKITVRQLLQHTSGLPEYLEQLPHLFDQAEFEQHRFDTLAPEDAVALATKSAPVFEPGTEWSYSNTNYALAGMIIAEVTGNTWQHEVQARIIRPLGLRDTYTPGTSPHVPGPHAVGYQRFTPESADVDVTALNPSWGGAAGEIISTTADGNRFLRALVGGEVLRPAQLAEMQKTVRAAKFDEGWPGARYGLGLMWVPNSCGGSWSHGGDIHGFKTRNGVSPDGSRSVVVSINTDSMTPKPGVPAPTQDVTVDLIDHALCATG